MKTKHYQTQQPNWRGVPLIVVYSPDCSRYGRALANLTIKAPCPLPIAGTGFLPHLIKLERVYGGAAPPRSSWPGSIRKSRRHERKHGINSGS